MAWTRTKCPSHPQSKTRRPLRSDGLAESEIASVPAPIGRGHHWIFGLNANPATTTHATCAARRSCRTCMPRQPPQENLKEPCGKKRLPPPPTRASEPANLVADPGRERREEGGELRGQGVTRDRAAGEEGSPERPPGFWGVGFGSHRGSTTKHHKSETRVSGGSSLGSR